MNNLFLPTLPEQIPQLEFNHYISYPVKIASIELLRVQQRRLGVPLLFPTNDRQLHIIRTRSTDGAIGISVAHERIKYFYPILQQLIFPYFIGKDARNLETLIDGVYTYRSNYKLSGLALWCCVAWLEISILDLLGKIAGKSLGELFGGAVRSEIPVYLSSLRRDTTPEEEIEWVGQRLAQTNAKAVKFKIGGRMSNNADAMPQRTEKLVALAGKTLGESIAIGVDANGSFDAHQAIEVGKMLESHNVAFFEEPCPFDELEATKQVNQTLSIAITAGEQETSLARFKQMIKHRIVDVLQPDIVYNGGFIRTLRVAQVAAQYGIPITIHNARLGVDSIYMLHFASLFPDNYQEYNAKTYLNNWFQPNLEVKNGVLSVPHGSGLGFTIDPSVMKKARKLATHRI